MDSKILAGLTDDERADLLATANEERYSQGDYITRQASPNGHLYLLVDGEVEVSRVAESGRSSRLAQLGAGAILGELSWISGTPPTASVRCLEPTVVLRLDGAHLLEQIEEGRPAATKLVLALLRMLAERLLMVNDELANADGPRTSELQRLRENMLRDWSF